MPSLAQDENVPDVMVTIKPLHSLVAGVMGDTGTPELLITGNVSPHEFQLKPSQVKNIAKAGVIFYIDDGFETFLHNAFATLPASVHRIGVAKQEGIKLLGLRRGGVWDVDADELGAHDMHVWLDPENAKKIIRMIAEEMSVVHAEHRATYLRNADAMIARLDALDSKLKQDLSGLHDKPFIVFHDAYHYLERHYGLKAVGSITFEPEESPSPRRISQLRAKLKETKAVCVFSEPYFSDKLVNIVTEGSTARSAALDPEATALPAGPDLYFLMLEQLATSIRNCLEGD